MSSNYLKRVGVASGVAGCLFAMAFLFRPSGYSEVRSSATALTDNPQAVLEGDKINRLTQDLIPFQFSINSVSGTPSPMTLVDAVYCGAENPKQAKLLAIGHPGPPPPKRPTRILTKSDCSMPLDSIAKKALLPADAPDWVVVSDIPMTWTPWELKLTVRDAATGVKSGATAHPPSDLKAQLQNGGQPFKILKTADVHLTIEGTDEQYNLALQFIDQNIFIMAIPSAEIPTFDLQAFLATDTSLAKLVGPTHTSLIAKLSYNFTSNLLNTDLKDREFVLQKSASGSPTITVRSLNVSGSTDTFTLTGRVRDVPNNFEANATINCQGQDLKIASIKLDAILDSCNGLSPLEKAKCIAALKAKAVLFATVLTNRYKDMPLRPIGPSQPFPSQIGGKNYNVKSVVLRSQSTVTALVFYMDFALEATQ